MRISVTALRRRLGGSLLLIGTACVGTPAAPPPNVRPISPPHVTLLHINDVYEIGPLEDGRVGGLARVATILRRLEAENPNTVLTLGGDFLSPSALSVAVVDNAALNGRQMVAVLNTIGLDLATFGNHEFDLGPSDLLARIQESEFGYVSTHITDSSGQPIQGTSQYRIVSFEQMGGGPPIRIGFVGATLPTNRPAWTHYAPLDSALAPVIHQIRDSVDALIGLTHLTLGGDIQLVNRFPEIDLILGGHEHENVAVRRGVHATPILKADANARSVVVVDLWFEPQKPVAISYRLIPITDSVPEDPATKHEVDRWMGLADRGFREAGFEPGRVVVQITETLDGLVRTTRTRPTNLTSLIAEAMRREANTDLAIFNTGSIRIDDMLPPGPVTEYDLIRILPFGGPVVEVEMTGRVLVQVLNAGRANAGTGGYLAQSGVTESAGGEWRIGTSAIDPASNYRVALSAFLARGAERNLGFLSTQNPGVTRVRTLRDIRYALRDELVRRYRR